MTEEIKHARFGGGEERRKTSSGQHRKKAIPLDAEIERNRVLTMKYGKQQMMLIRKRMQVENWIEEQLTTLYNGNENNGVELELDEILDIEAAQLRRKHAYEQLQKNYCPASMDKITIFLDELIRQLATL